MHNEFINVNNFNFICRKIYQKNVESQKAGVLANFKVKICTYKVKQKLITN